MRLCILGYFKFVSLLCIECKPFELTFRVLAFFLITLSLVAAFYEATLLYFNSSAAMIK